MTYQLYLILNSQDSFSATFPTHLQEVIHDFPNWINAEERNQIGKFLQRIEFSRDIEEQPRKGKFSVHDMKTLEEYDIIKDSTDHESAKKYFLDLTKKYFDGKTPIEGNLFILC